ncbi:MAG: MFS transporter [Candidatus Heimdallarchaeota archaeon]|nr:MFS transporter [Candidatus Heimdallarchaeota archaeon]
MTEEHFRSKGYMNFLIIFLGFVALVDQYLSLIETATIDFILEDFGISFSEFSLWQGIVSILAFFVFLISWLGVYFGRRTGMGSLILIMSIPAVIIGLVGPSSFTLFIILYGIMIMGTNVNFWAIPISEESPANKRGQYGAIVFLIGLLPLYAFLGGPISRSLGWQWAFGLMGIFGILTFIMLYFMKETKRWEENQEEFKHSKDTFIKSVKLISKDDWKFIGIYGAIYICWSTGFKLVTTSLKLLYTKVIGLSDTEWDGILTIGGLMTIVGALTIGIILEKAGRIPAFIWSVGGAVIAFLGLALTSASVFAIAIYFFMASVLGFLLVYNAEMLPTEIRGVGIGILSTFSRVGFVVGPLLVYTIIPEVDSITSSNLADFNTLYYLGAIIMTLPFLSLFYNRKETRGKTLEEISEK